MKILFVNFLVFSNTLNLFCQTAGDNLFNNLAIHTIEINFSQPGYWSDLVSNKSYDDANDSSTYIPAAVIIDGVSLDSVGIQFKGNSSYYNYPSNKKPFTLSFNEYITGQKFDGLKNINLNNCYQDPTLMREKLFLDFANEHGLNAPRANYARVFINGTYWGMYLMVERINKTYLNDRMGNNDGNLFKGDNGTPACADLKFHGTLASYYNCYTLKTNKPTNDWTDLINLTDQINNTSDSNFKDSVDNVLNTNSFIGAWAMYNMFVDFDSYPYRFIHNYYIYHNTATNKFDWIIWDVSTAFGMDVPASVAAIENTSIYYIQPNANDRPLVERMLSDSAFKNLYESYICLYLQDFQPSFLNPKIDSIYNLISSDVYLETMNMYSNTNFDENINDNITIGSITYPGLKSFILNRSNNIQNELTGLGINCTLVLSSVPNTKYDFELYPNPTNNTVNVEFFLESISSVSVDLTNISGQTINLYSNELSSPGKLKYTLDISDLSKGIYFLRLTINQSVYTKKIAVL